MTPLTEEKAKMLKAMAHPIRVWIVEELMQGERCVCYFVEKSQLDFSTISKHLLLLKHAHIVTSQKRGKQIFYSLQAKGVVSLLQCLDNYIVQKICSIEKHIRRHKRSLNSKGEEYD